MEIKNENKEIDKKDPKTSEDILFFSPELIADLTPLTAVIIEKKQENIGVRLTYAEMHEFATNIAKEVLSRKTRKLSDEQRDLIYESIKYSGGEGWETDFSDIVDAVEEAHNIGEQVNLNISSSKNKLF